MPSGLGNTLGSSALAATQPVERLGGVSREYEVMTKNLESLRVLVSDLEVRLAPITAERSETKDAETSQPEPVRVPFAQSLYNSNVMLVEQESRLRSLLNRVEL